MPNEHDQPASERPHLPCPEIEAENAKLRLACAAYRKLIQNEYHWESWRGDTSPRGSASERNAKVLWNWLQEHGVENAGQEIQDNLAALEATNAALAERLAAADYLTAKWRLAAPMAASPATLHRCADELEAAMRGE